MKKYFALLLLWGCTVTIPIRAPYVPPPIPAPIPETDTTWRTLQFVKSNPSRYDTSKSNSDEMNSALQNDSANWEYRQKTTNNKTMREWRIINATAPPQ